MAKQPRKATSAGKAKALPVVSAQPCKQQMPHDELDRAPSHHREHPDKISGQALRDLAHRKGMAKSELAKMPDDKIRTQLKYIDYRRASEDAVV